MPRKSGKPSGGGDVDLTASVQASFEGSPSPINSRFTGLGQDIGDELPMLNVGSRAGDPFAFLDDVLTESLTNPFVQPSMQAATLRFTNLDFGTGNPGHT